MMIGRFSAGTRRFLAIAAGGALALTSWVALAGEVSADAQDRVQLVRVATPTPQAKQRLGTLGLDVTESAGPAFVDVVLHRASDAEALRRAGLGWQVRIADLGAEETRARQADRAYAAGTAVSGLPSGRTSYRRLGDYEAEMVALARRHPGLVRRFTLPHRTLEGRAVHGIEIGHRVRARDGRPVFLMMGLHHAREWPSGELTMEFGYDQDRFRLPGPEPVLRARGPQHPRPHLGTAGHHPDHQSHLRPYRAAASFHAPGGRHP